MRQAKITTSEQQIKDLTDRVEQLERLNEQLTLRARDLEVANQAAAQNAVLSSVRCLQLPLVCFNPSCLHCSVPCA